MCVPNLDLPLDLNANVTTGNQKIDMAIKKIYEDMWKYCLQIFKTNMKYDFLFKKIIEPNEFCDIHSAKEYLLQNICNEEQTAEQSQLQLNLFYNNLQFGLLNIFKEVDTILKQSTNTHMQHDVVQKKIENETLELDINLERKLQMAIEEHKRNMDMKIKNIEIENEKLKVNESEYASQINTLLGELAFRNRKLTYTTDRLSLLTREKNDLINTIEKLEVKGEGFQTLQNKFEKEREKNNRLKAILAKEYKNDIDFHYYCF